MAAPALVAATSTLTSTGVFVDTKVVIVGGKTYTSQATLTNVDGNYLIGLNQTASHLNLLNAINLGTGAGTTYAAAMTANTQVKGVSSDGTHTIVQAKIKGTIGNQIATTETQDNASWTGLTMASGTGDAIAAIDQIRDVAQCNAEVQQYLNNILNFA